MSKLKVILSQRQIDTIRLLCGEEAQRISKSAQPADQCGSFADVVDGANRGSDIRRLGGIMNALESAEVSCPACGERLVFVGVSEDGGSGMPEPAYCSKCDWRAE